ncbi:MAG: CvpA family protein [Actinomycetota bacterium]
MVVDAAIIAFTGFFTWRGYRRGLLSAVSRLVAFGGATAAAVFGYRVLASPLQASGLSAGTANIAGAMIIFVGVSIVFWFGARTLTRLLDVTKWGMVNHAGGAVFAAAWSLSIVVVVLLAMTVAPV